jgi:FKBP-type peptidyl-prolyl cis-trans isomerase
MDDEELEQEVESTEERPYDVNADGTVLKVIIDRTSLEEFPDHPLPRPMPGARVCAHITGKLVDSNALGRVFWSSKGEGDGSPLQFVVGAPAPQCGGDHKGHGGGGGGGSVPDGFPCAGVSSGLMTMKREEKSKFLIVPAAAHSSEGLPDRGVPPNARVV